MLTASNAASPEVVKQVRQGFSNIEGVLQNTTNIPSSEDVASVVKQNMQVGAAAARRAEQIKADKVVTTKPATTVTTTTTPTSTETTTTTVTGGEATVTQDATIVGKTTTGKAYDPYAVYGPNAGKAKQYDDLIAQLETEQFEGYLSGNAVDLRDSIKELYALKDALRVE